MDEPEEDYSFGFADLLGTRQVPLDQNDYDRLRKLKEHLNRFFQAVNVASTETLISDCLASIETYRRRHPKSALAPVAAAVGIFTLRPLGVAADLRSACESLSLSRRLVGRALKELESSSPRPSRSLACRAFDVLESLVPKLSVQISDETVIKVRESMNLLISEKILSPASLSAGVLGLVLFWAREKNRKISVRTLAEDAQVPLSSTYHALKAIEVFFSKKPPYI